MAIAAGVLTLACSKHESSNGTVSHDSTAMSAAPASSAAPPTAAAVIVDSIVRGSVIKLNDKGITVSTSAGSVDVALAEPATVYTSQPGDLSKVTDNAFIGVTSVPQPDGTQRATEIHVFPAELRGLGEGSRPMGPPGGNSRSTMTNGSVANSRMTNGNARMTNGTSQGAAGGTMTVNYNGGSQAITVPADVLVTVIVPTSFKLTTGTSVIVPAAKQPDGSLKATAVMLPNPRQPARK